MSYAAFKRNVPWLAFLIAVVLPALVSGTLVSQLTKLYPYAILGLALNVVVGYTGILHLGIMAFFTIGVFTTAIASSGFFPFEYGFLPSILIAMLLTGVSGVILGSPTLRLRGDYLALVTLGFGEMVKDTLINLPAITRGIQGINLIPPPPTAAWWETLQRTLGIQNATMYFLNLTAIAIVWKLLSNLEASRWGRAWIALREDELAAVSTGINPEKLKLAAFALCATLTGMAGALTLFSTGNSNNPKDYDFNKSILVLAGVILGGIGNRAGVVLGVLLVFGFDQIGMVWVTDQVKSLGQDWLMPNKWNLMLYGGVLILMMRFRPEGLLPEERLTREIADHVPN